MSTMSSMLYSPSGESAQKLEGMISFRLSMAYKAATIIVAIYADNFSLEASNVTDEQVDRLHNAGKELYAWTVNTEESINNMIDMNVDNIITDNIELGKELVAKSKNSNLINEILKLFDK